MVPATLYAERGFQTLLSADVDGVSGDELLKINATVQSGKDRLTVKVYKPGLGLSLTQTSTFTFDSEAPNSSSIWPKYIFRAITMEMEKLSYWLYLWIDLWIRI